jgi:hypothetical protein
MRAARLIACALASLLSACGNAYERVYLEKWRAIGTVGIPTDPFVRRTKFRLETLEPGQGAPIELGSLVHARIRGSLERADYRGHRSRTDDDVWFWIGNEEPYVKNRVSIRLGSGELRAALIGARAGARLSLVFDSSGQVGTLFHVPRKGFLLDHTEDVYMGPGVDTGYAQLSVWRDYEIAILAVCRGRLLRREGVMKQWGYVLNLWSGPTHSFAREAPLVWGAIEGDCDSGKQRVRFEKGPALHPYSGSLSGWWPHSYERAVRLGRVSRK